MKRIVLHWTAGTHTPSSLDKHHYHFIVDGDGIVHTGTFPVSANKQLVKGAYAAHTRGCNTESIGVAVAAMAGAVERPFSPGNFPVTKGQMTALYKLCADLADKYDIPVTRWTILSHAEVEPTLGIKQRGKWDFTWLPHYSSPTNPVLVGDEIRDAVGLEIAKKAVPVPKVSQKLGFFGRIMAKLGVKK